MKYFILVVQYFLVFAWYLMLASAVSGSDLSRCSCYTFHSNASDWADIRNLCKSNGGDFVVMETLAEWEFIKAQIQNKTTSTGHNQWWIGLVRENGVWRWVNGYNLTYDKWTKGLEIYKYKNQNSIIDKSDGMFWNVYWYVKMGTICENTGSACNGEHVEWCYKVTTTKQPTTILRDTMKDVTSNRVTIVTESVTSTIQTMTTNSSAEGNNELSDKKTDKDFPVLIVVIVIVVLLVCIGIFVFIWICRKKRKKKDDNQKDQEKAEIEQQEGQEFLLKQSPPIHVQKPQDDSSCIYATVDKSKMTNKDDKPIVYAEIQNSNEGTNQEEELKYAELTDFTTKESQEMKRPPPYQPTEYASITVDDQPQ